MPDNAQVQRGNDGHSKLPSLLNWSSQPSTTTSSSRSSQDDIRKPSHDTELDVQQLASALELTEPEVPYHVLSKVKKVLVVSLVSTTATLSGLSSNVYFPAQEQGQESACRQPSIDNCHSIGTVVQRLLPSSGASPRCKWFFDVLILLLNILTYFTGSPHQLPNLHSQYKSLHDRPSSRTYLLEPYR
jgi:hypothetical protein